MYLSYMHVNIYALCKYTVGDSASSKHHTVFIKVFSLAYTP